MKRVRQPFGETESPNSPPPSSSSAQKRARQQQQQQQRQRHHDETEEADQRQLQQQQQHGPFQALLCQHGVVWPSAAAMADEESYKRVLGFSCRSNPSKLRLAVEKALVYDRARRSEFVESMREFMAGPVQALRRALLPLDCCGESRAAAGGGMGGRAGFIAAAAAAAGGGVGGGRGANAIHESLVKVLLRVDCIQPEVIDMLLEKIPELVGEEETGAEGGYGSGAAAPERTFSWQARDLPRLVLNQVRFLDHLVDSTSLTKKILEVLTVLPVNLQREMISYLPEVVEDGDHAEVVETLQGLKDSEPQLLVAVLDALGNLSLPPRLLGGITEDALGLLDSAQPSTLPVLVRFLLETATADTADAVVKELRERLRLCPVAGAGGRGGVEDTEETEALVLNPGLQGNRCEAPSDSDTSGDALTLEALRQGLRLRGDLAVCFLKAITKTAGSEGHSVVDLWVLFCLYANQDMRKRVMALFRRKISGGHFTEPLMTDALHGRAGALHGLFFSLMGITDALVSSGVVSVRRYGASMYREIFSGFSEAYHRQEVVGALITHCGAGSEVETDSALSALSALASPRYFRC
ncbi:unnamed protein product [Ectocarpus fasciculatus]